MIKNVYNLIILDRSGSMSTIIRPTIAGVNETLNTIRVAEEQTGLRQLVTLVSFCGCSTNYFCDSTPIKEVREFTHADYRPCCNTPLYDAIGEAVTKLKAQVGNDLYSAVSVTIITDGYENSSRKWNRHSVKALIELLKAEGWMIAFIGANQDVDYVCRNLSIDNGLAFSTESDEEVEKMFARERSSRIRYSMVMASADNICCCAAPRNYFAEEDEK